MIVYLSGPMTGHPNNNYEAFKDAQKQLEQSMPEVKVINPADWADLGSWKENLSRDLLCIINEADAIYVLPGWSNSEGSKLEVDIAKRLNLPVVEISGRVVWEPAHKLLIGLSGYAESGKDTIGRYLVDNYGFVRISFADNLKDLAREFGWNGEKDEAGRAFLQKLGTAVRSLHPEAWINAIEPTVMHTLMSHPVVITDVRFQNEAAWIKRMGGQVWRVHRVGVGPANNHISETDLDMWEFDHVVMNQTDYIDTAYYQVDRLMEMLGIECEY